MRQHPRLIGELSEYMQAKLKKHMAVVHLAVRNPLTEEIGWCYAETSDLHTYCGKVWRNPFRPRRTLLKELVTCRACLEAPEKLYKVLDGKGGK